MADAVPRPVRAARWLMVAAAAVTAVTIAGYLVAGGPAAANLGAAAWPALPAAASLLLALHLPRGGRTMWRWIVALQAANALLALARLGDGDPRGLTSLILPVAILILVTRASARPHFQPVQPYVAAAPGSGGERGAPGGERGVSLVEWGAMLLVVALIVATLASGDVRTAVGEGTRSAVCRVFSSGGCVRPGAPAPGQAGQAPGQQGAGQPPGQEGAGQPPGQQGGPGGAKTSGKGESGLVRFARSFNDKARKLPGAIWDLHRSAFDTVWNDGKGLVEVVTNPSLLVDAARAAKNDPIGTLKGLVWDEEAQQHWDKGDKVQAIGRVWGNVGSSFVPGAGQLGKIAKVGKAGKIAKAAKAGQKAGETGKAGKAGKAVPPSRQKGDGPGAACPLRNSFVPGTPVLLADGSYKPIEDVAVGDRVWATDPSTGRGGSRPVTGLISGAGHKDLVEITIDPDNRIGGPAATVTATGEHPFWIARTRGWTGAADLHRGDALRTPAGRQVTVVKIREFGRVQRVHNLAVAGPHTYYVRGGPDPRGGADPRGGPDPRGGADVLVHNAAQPGPGRGGCGVSPQLYQRIVETQPKPTTVQIPGRRKELPYTQPPGTMVAGPGRAIDVNRLDPRRTYLWVIDSRGNFRVAPETDPSYAGIYGNRRGQVLKHGDLASATEGPGRLGPEGVFVQRPAARMGGELKAQVGPDGQVSWIMDNNSSYSFLRPDGTVLRISELQGARNLLAATGTDTSRIGVADAVPNR